MDRHRPHQSDRTAPAMRTRNMAGRKDNSQFQCQCRWFVYIIPQSLTDAVHVNVFNVFILFIVKYYDTLLSKLVWSQLYETLEKWRAIKSATHKKEKPTKHQQRTRGRSTSQKGEGSKNTPGKEGQDKYKSNNVLVSARHDRPMSWPK